MKTIKRILIVAAIAALTGNLFAQNSVAALPALPAIPADLTSTAGDIVTQNSVMYYLVTPDPIIDASPFYNNSVFNWTVTQGTILGTTAAAAPLAAYKNENQISIDYDAVAVGSYANNISVIERSVPTFSAGAGCDGSTEYRNVQVVARPLSPSIAVADENQGDCGSSGSFTIPYGLPAEVSGNYPLYVEFIISAFDVDNNAIGTPQTRIYSLATPTTAFTLLDADLDLADPADANATPDGVKYTIDLTNVWDQYSVRASNRTDADVVTLASANDVNIYILPTPTTGTINHVAP